MKKPKNHLKEYNDFLVPPKAGDIVKGRVIEQIKKGVLVEIGNYKIGLINKEDLNSQDIFKIKKGEEISAKVVDINGKDDLVNLSLREANKDLAWRQLQELTEKKEKISLRVISANRGGLILNFQGIQGFLPASQLSRENYPKIDDPTPEKILQELKKFVGQEMKVKVINADHRKRKLIFSEE